MGTTLRLRCASDLVVRFFQHLVGKLAMMFRSSVMHILQCRICILGAGVFFLQPERYERALYSGKPLWSKQASNLKAYTGTRISATTAPLRPLLFICKKCCMIEFLRNRQSLLFIVVVGAFPPFMS